MVFTILNEYSVYIESVEKNIRANIIWMTTYTIQYYICNMSNVTIGAKMHGKCIQIYVQL